MGIIALFIVMIYGFAALTLGATAHLTEPERFPIVWFLVIFPVIVLATFGWLVSHHHEKLYAPADYKNDDNFLKGLVAKSRHTTEVQEQQVQLKSKIHDAMIKVANQIQNVNSPLDSSELDIVIEKIVNEIDNVTSISVDATKFLNDKNALYTFPIAAFSNLSDLTNEVYFKIAPNVSAYHYGRTWVLRDKASGKVVKNVRMLSDVAAGIPMTDRRSLSEVGIRPGSVLVVEKIYMQAILHT